MVPFAGYEMPLNYGGGIVAEHKQCRAAAGLFDVSHMGQLRLDGADAVAGIETLVPGDIAALAPGRLRYTMLTNDAGGIRDDLMIGRAADHLSLVVNAACKAADLAYIAAALPTGVTIRSLDDRSLLALQGPKAADVMGRIAPAADALTFMSAAAMPVDGIDCTVARAGYTGEDGFEISVPAEHAVELAERLLDQPDVGPVGLGARDSLRLEAGLCLYGHDLDETTSPIEAGLAWTISKRRRAAGGYPGAERIAQELADGPARRRIGLRPAGRAMAREGAAIRNPDGAEIGVVTSGGFGPSAGAPVAMGYVGAAPAPGAGLQVDVRGKPHDATVAAMPFVPHRYHKS